ncbi:hypothetical protein [Saccharomonospora amisosensis]|uniref:hypothetical protein n=1 Tax=Saccharomonospora amisosensis TaxID=1128677 RepID=UPI0036F24EB8
MALPPGLPPEVPVTEPDREIAVAAEALRAVSDELRRIADEGSTADVLETAAPTWPTSVTAPSPGCSACQCHECRDRACPLCSWPRTSHPPTPPDWTLPRCSRSSLAVVRRHRTHRDPRQIAWPARRGELPINPRPRGRHRGVGRRHDRDRGHR